MTSMICVVHFRKLALLIHNQLNNILFKYVSAKTNGYNIVTENLTVQLFNVNNTTNLSLNQSELSISSASLLE